MAEASKQLMALVKRMDSGNAREMAAAREELAQMGPLAVSRLVAELQKTPNTGKKLSMLLLGLRIILLPALLIGVVIVALLALLVASDGSLGCIGDVGCMGGWFDDWNPRRQYHEHLHNQQWNQIARVLARLEDVQVAGPLAEALNYADTNTRPTLMTALYRLVPLMDANTARMLTVGQRTALYHLLESAKDQLGQSDRNLSLAILRVTVLAEDTQAISIVERIAASAASQDVAQAAAQTSEQLKAIAQRQEISQSLLRGASAPATPSDMLLRPAQGGESTQPEQLLRAVVSEPPAEP